jgi:hypothetical protein
MPSPATVAGGLLLLVWTGSARAQAPGERPSEQDIFGGSAPTPAPPAASPDGGVVQAPAPDAPPSTPQPPASQASDRDQVVLGGNAPAQLSDYIAPENPLQIGGQLYLRAQTSALEGQLPDAWSLTAPSLLDAYFDARPNPRVRAFVLGRMGFNPTAAPSGAATAGGLGMGGNQGAFSGGSATGFTTFSANRGPTSILDQMWIRFDVLGRVFVTAGKQHVRWGTGRFWQPTDYLHPIKRNPLDVFDARAGVTMLKLHVPWEERGWNFYGFAVFEDPNAASNTLRTVSGAARAEIVIAGAELGLDVLARRDRKPRFGIDLSMGLWDFDVYADVGLRAGEDFNVVRKVDADPALTCTDPNDPTMQLPIDDLSRQYQVVPLSGVKTQSVVGANYSRKYNDNDIFLIGAEYFYNQPGYSDTSLYPGLLFNNTGSPMLNFFYTGRHYAALFASLPQPYSWNKTTFTLSTLGNLADMSFVSRLDYAFTLLTHVTLEAFGAVHYGSRGGEFRLGFDVAAQRVLNPDATCRMIDPFTRDPVLFDLGIALRMKI